MHKVINKEEYVENWKDLGDCVCFILLDAAIAIGMLALMVVSVVPAALVCTFGWSTDVEDEDGKD